MKHNIIFFILFFLISCGEQEVFCRDDVSYIIKNVCIYTSGMDIKSNDVNVALDIIHWNWYNKFGIDETEILDLYVTDIDQASIDFRSELCDEKDKTKCYLGLTDRSYVKLLYSDKQKECFANTAIGHEFLHALGFLFEMKYGHDNPDLFLSAEMIEDCYYFGLCGEAKETLENKINVEMCNYFCSDSCSWWKVE